jgi:hypothetical protein
LRLPQAGSLRYRKAKKQKAKKQLTPNHLYFIIGVNAGKEVIKYMSSNHSEVAEA